MPLAGSAMPHVFISYRRDDSLANARLLSERLQESFTDGKVFMDVKNIGLGDDWRDVLRRHIEASEFVLVVIGPQWLELRDARGQRRLDDDNDVVRWEIAEALRMGKTVIPVTVDNARIPSAAELPADIARLPALQGQPLSPLRFEDDVQALIARLEGSRDTRDAVQRLRQRLRMGRVSLVVAACVVVAATSLAWANLFDLLGLDTRSANFTMLIGDVLVEPTIDDALLLVGIRPTDAEKERLDPRRRLQYAQLIDAAVREGARRVVFDITLRDDSEFDAPLRDAIRRAHQHDMPVTFGFNALDQGAPRLPPGFADTGVSSGLTCVGRRLGNVTYGNLLLQSDRGVFGSLDFYAAQAPAAIDPLPSEGTRQRFRNQAGGVEEVRFSLRETVSVADADCPARTPGSEMARLIVRLSHKERWRDPVRRVALQDLLNDTSAASGRLHGSVVLVGAEHPSDILKTRLDGTPSRFGFEFHADVINALLTNYVVHPVSFLVQWVFVAVLIAVAVGWRRARLGRPRRAEWLVLGVLCVVVVGIAVVLYAHFGWLIDSLYHLGALLVTWWLLARLERKWGAAAPAR